jgi:flagellar hook-associated protein 2
MVSAANTVLSALQKYAGYNEATKTGGPLMGSAVLQNLTNQIQSVFASVTGTSNLGDAQNLGITLSKGQLSFDKSTFETAFSAHPRQVEAMFTQGGTFAPASSTYTGEVTLLDAANATAPGSYAVDVSHSATQAVDTGAVLSSGAVSVAETLTLTTGTSTATYTTTAGESLANVAAGINQALASQGMGMSASVIDSGDQLQLASTNYGSSASFSVTSTDTASGTTGLAGSTAGTAVTYAGTDVAGTIDGVAATGNGQFLTVPTSSSSPAAGLSLQVTAPGITSATNLGTYTYSPGIAQALASLAAAMTAPVTGSITETIANLQGQSQGLNGQIAFYTTIAAEEQKMLSNQFSALQATLGSLQNQSQSLASALSGLSTL